MSLGHKYINFIDKMCEGILLYILMPIMFLMVGCWMVMVIGMVYTTIKVFFGL